MRALVVFESMYGNTHAVAVGIAAGLPATHEVTLVPVSRGTGELVTAAGLIVAGGPTHLHGMSSVASRRAAAETAGKPGSGLIMDPDAGGPGLRTWLEELRVVGVPATSFDTRLSGMPALTGRATRAIARVLIRRGCHLLLPPESFFTTSNRSLPGISYTTRLLGRSTAHGAGRWRGIKGPSGYGALGSLAGSGRAEFLLILAPVAAAERRPSCPAWA